MKAEKKFTDASVKKLTAPDDTIIWDPGMTGFGVRVRVGKNGDVKRFYVCKWSIDGKPGKMTLGRVDQMNLEDARGMANKHFDLVADKVCPHEKRADEKTKLGEMFEAKVEAFLEWKANDPDQKRSEEYIKTLRRTLTDRFSDLHGLALGKIKRSKIVEILDEIARENGYRASGMARAVLSSYFAYLLDKGYDGGNPVSGIKARKINARERSLSKDELRLVWKATNSGSDYDNIVRLIILTGSRKTMIGSLLREHVNRKEGIIDLPTSKNGTRFLIALSAQAQEIIDKVIDKRAGSPFVFGEGGQGGFSGWSKAKAALDAKIAELNGGKPIADWVLHDLRRTFVSLGIDECGIDDRIADVIINHIGEAKKGNKGTYNHATYKDEKRTAMAAWGKFVAGLTRPDLTVVKKAEEIA
jgi:integrase